jgi:hypothetical protein
MARRTGVVVAMTVAGALMVGALASFAVADSGNRNFDANRLLGAFEVPAISTTGRGSFEARLQNDTTVSYTLRWSGLQAAPTQAHIHFGQKDVNGGISVWLCEGAMPAPASVADDTPACPASGSAPFSGSVTDTFDASEVVGPAGQGITGATQAEFEELLAAIRAGLTYANVHSATFGGGEIRGQIGRGGGGDDDDD